MSARRLAIALCIAGGAMFLARCPDSNVVTGPAVPVTTTAAAIRSATATRTPAASSTPPAPTSIPSPTVTPLGQTSEHGIGSVTWTSITTARPLCPEIRGQVGSSFSVSVTLQTQGSSVVLTLDQHDDEPGVYAGTLAGDAITAAYQGPFGGLACPSDTTITPETRGDLTATLSANGIQGQYTEVYGSGTDAVTFGFEFQAHFDAP